MTAAATGMAKLMEALLPAIDKCIEGRIDQVIGTMRSVVASVANLQADVHQLHGAVDRIAASGDRTAYIALLRKQCEIAAQLTELTDILARIRVETDGITGLSAATPATVVLASDAHACDDGPTCD